MADFLTTPTFVIGLGGIGQQVTFRLANRLENTFRGNIPETIIIRSFDTAPEEITEIPVSKLRHFTRLGQFDADQLIQHLEYFPAIRAWWDYHLTPGFISAGAHQERPVGRLIFFKEIERIYKILEDDFKIPLGGELQRKLIESGHSHVSRTPKVFLVGSLAGGTCSGMLIDMAFLIKWVLKEVGYESAAIDITAVLGLESVINVVTQDSTSEAARHRRLNVNSALKEIDFLQGGKTGFSLQYPEPVGRREPIPPLFDKIYFFTSQKMGGHFLDNQEDILNRVAHFIFGNIASPVGQKAKTILDDRRTYFNPDLRLVGDGLKAIYGAFGVEWLEVPKRHLLTSWCQNHADLLANLVVEFDWANEPKENLLRTFRENLTGNLNGYRKALDLLESGGQEIFSQLSFADLNLKIAEIQNAHRKKDLVAALHDYEATLPQLLPPIIRNLTSVGADAGQESAWLMEFIKTLFRDRRFRMGGARRVLQEGAQYLRRLLAPPEIAMPLIQDVVPQCCNWWGRVSNPAPALEWAKTKTYQVASQILRTTLGPRAEELAKKLEECVAGIRRLQEEVGNSIRELRKTATPGDTLPKDSWLFNPADIQGLLEENPQEVAKRGAEEILDRLAAEITLEMLRSQQTTVVEKSLRYWVESAMEKAIEKLVRRPADNVERIKKRIPQCEPLARIITEGPEFHRIMKDSQKASPLKIVLTSLDEERREELQQWAKEEEKNKGGMKMYEVFPSQEDLRDDILHLTFGWPLWLFNEIRTSEEEIDKIKESEPIRYRNSFLFIKQIPEIKDHQIRPFPESDARQWFGIALALRHIDFGAHEIVFAPERFPGLSPIEDQDIGSRIEKAYRLFREQGLAYKYKTYLRGEESKDKAAVKKSLEEGVANRIEALQAAYETGQIPQEVYNRLMDFYHLAKKYAEGIVIL